MGDETIKFEMDGLSFQFRLIWRYYFQQGEGDLDYLQFVRDPDALEQMPPRRVKNLEESKLLYDQNIGRVCLEFKEYFQDKKNRLFTPQAIMKPGSRRPELQKPPFDVLRELFSDPGIPDLSVHFTKDNNHKGIKTQELVRDIDADLTKIEHILFIDDVYSGGNTVSSIMSLLGKERSFVIVCPLRRDKSVNEFMKDVKNAQKKT